jgi:thiamine-monophosphate kinase
MSEPCTETDFVTELKSIFHVPEGSYISIGDDAAVFPTPSNDCICTTDTFVEDVHFKKSWCTPSELGERFLASNMSDITAMGGRSRHGFLSLQKPASWTTRELLAFCEGIQRRASRFGISILGGNITKANAFSSTLFLVGEKLSEKIVTRGGANAGDMILCTGIPGSAALAEALFATKVSPNQWPDLYKTWINPSPRLDIISELLPYITSMTDMSDGLYSDIQSLAKQSGHTFFIQDEVKPPASLQEMCTSVGKTFSHFFWGPSDDYEFVFTAEPRALSILQAQEFDGVTVIGCVKEGPSGVSMDKKLTTKVPQNLVGWDHLSGKT